MKEITPVQEYEKNGKTYRYEYKHRRTKIDNEKIDYIETDKIRCWVEDDTIKWKYKDQDSITIMEDKVMVPDDMSVESAEKTAYFALWRLDEMGITEMIRV